MFEAYAEKSKLALRSREQLTSGSVNAYRIRFAFSSDWSGLERTAVFKAGPGGEAAGVLLDEANECAIPWEVLVRPGVQLLAGVYGTRGGDLVLPTIWVSLGTVLQGAAPGEDARPPTPELWEQTLAGKGDRLDYTGGGDLGLYAGDRLLSAVPVQGGGEGGTRDHRLLSHRDAEGQHPIGAVEGLEEELRRIPEAVEPLTNEELEAILK